MSLGSPRVGCVGFPVGRERYCGSFSAVELDSPFYALPREATAEKWRREAPEGFEFSLPAWQALTHPASSPGYRRFRPKLSPARLARLGHFRDNEEVREAWTACERVVSALEPTFVLFRTPASFYPNADHLRDMYRFFKRIRRPRSLLVWEPRGSSWEDRLVERVCGDLGLQHGVDPRERACLRGAVRYFRVRRPDWRSEDAAGRALGDTELRELLARCEGAPSYVFFATQDRWMDARRFAELADPVRAGWAAAERRGRPPRGGGR